MAGTKDEQKVIFRCRGCGQKLRAPVSRIGQATSCPKCGGRLAVPLTSLITSLPRLVTGLPARLRPMVRDRLGMTRREFGRKLWSRNVLAGAGIVAAAGGYLAYKKRQEWAWADDPRLGQGLGGFRPFPDDNAWNQDISQEPVDENSDVLISSIGADKPLRPECGFSYRWGPLGMPYILVGGNQPTTPVLFGSGAGESDPGPYKVPIDAPIEGGPNAKTGDRHVIVVDSDNWILYELFEAKRQDGRWAAESGAIFDLRSNTLRPAGWTSADAAGLPIFPGLLRHDEVHELGAIRHALRFTCKVTRRAYVPPARHFASPHKDPTLPPMGMRVRLRADYDVSGFSGPMQVVLECLKRYGMFLADNGNDWFLTGAYHPKWDSAEIKTLQRVKGGDFEVVRMDGLVEG